MKKIIWTFVIISCLAALSGCKSSDDAKTPTPSPKAEATAKTTETEAPAEEQVQETQPEATPAESAPATETEAPALEKEYVKGTVNGKSFESEYLGLRFSGTDNWVVIPEADAAKYPVGEDEITEFMAYDSVKRGSITVKTVTYNGGTIDAEVLASRIKYLSDLADSTAASAGGQVTGKGETLIENIAGQSYNGVSVKIDASGTVLTMISYIRKVSDSRLVEITISTPDSVYESQNEIITLFTAY